MNSNSLAWFEIPVLDMKRAVTFYETVFKIKLTKHVFGPVEMALFHGEGEDSASVGALCRSEGNYRPSDDGVLIYFSSLTDDLSDELGRIAQAGGSILIHKRQISEDRGYMALFLDSEGNRIALHSNK